jgi:hypothetical protein
MVGDYRLPCVSKQEDSYIKETYHQWEADTYHQWEADTYHQWEADTYHQWEAEMHYLWAPHCGEQRPCLALCTKAHAVQLIPSHLSLLIKHVGAVLGDFSLYELALSFSLSLLFSLSLSLALAFHQT